MEPLPAVTLKREGSRAYLYLDRKLLFCFSKRAGHLDTPTVQTKPAAHQAVSGRDMVRARLSARCSFPFSWAIWPTLPTPVRPLFPPPSSSISVTITRRAEGGSTCPVWGVCMCARAMPPMPCRQLARFLSRAGPSEWSGLHRSHVFMAHLHHGLSHTPSPPRHELFLDWDKLRWPYLGPSIGNERGRQTRWISLHPSRLPLARA